VKFEDDLSHLFGWKMACPTVGGQNLLDLLGNVDLINRVDLGHVFDDDLDLCSSSHSHFFELDLLMFASAGTFRDQG
jgi:hypothetical protein